ncbi:hypothetical protein MKEN_00414900 [Mycena kentingensis (nom. inval.)]|nr:hypothetical protein MKEN_00414900 [Mycena kentingensis (nom. inval.)]
MFSLIAPLLLAASVSATSHIHVPRCDISQAKMPIPPNQQTLVEPAHGPSFIGLAIGTQNYTCKDGTYTNVGAVAELFDVSCLLGSPEFPHLQDIAYDAWKFAPASEPGTIQSIISGLSKYYASFVLGEHYFVPNPSGTGLSPVWDFRHSFPDNHNALVLAEKVGGIPAPTGPPDVDWLSLKSVSGDLATQVFRTDTVGGSPPESKCSSGALDITVKYSSMYYLFGTKVQ